MSPVHKLGQMSDGKPDMAYTSVLLVLPTTTVRELNERCERGGLADVESARDDYVNTALIGRFEREPMENRLG